MELIGTLKAKNATQEVSATFSKREFVITTKEDYPQDILLEFTKDKCSILDGYELGQEVKVEYNLRGRGWQNPQGEMKYFNTLQAWKIDKTSTF